MSRGKDLLLKRYASKTEKKGKKKAKKTRQVKRGDDDDAVKINDLDGVMSWEVNASESDQGDDGGEAAEVEDASRASNGLHATKELDATRGERVDSDVDSDASPPRRGRVDSDVDSDASPPRRGRVDSDVDSDASPPRRNRKNSDELLTREKSVAAKKGSKTMSSGHSAGLHTGSQFKEREDELKKARLKEEADDVGKSGSNEQTTYRDEYGRVVDQQEVERLKEEKSQADKIAAKEKERERKKGKKQKEEEKLRECEAAEIAKEAFARRIDDKRMEAVRMEVDREGDPMKEYMEKERCRKEAELRKAGVKIKRTYKGPKGKPNRYGIPPGYRWDGICRGNGFEDEVLKIKVGKGIQQEKNYKYRTSDL